jgi:hypothetical protein
MWPALVEKAFVIHTCSPPLAPNTNPGKSDYHLIGNRFQPQFACRMLAGGHAHAPSVLHAGGQETPAQLVAGVCDEAGVTRFPTMASTVDLASQTAGLGWTRTGLHPNHCYAVLGLMPFPNPEFVVLRNPHHVQVNRPPGATEPLGYAQGNWKIRPADGEDRTVPLNQHTVFALPLQWFDRCFDSVGWVSFDGE